MDAPPGMDDPGASGIARTLAALTEAQRAVAALRRPPPSAATLHRQVAQVAATLSWPTPSYSTVYGIIHRLDPALRTFARGSGSR